MSNIKLEIKLILINFTKPDDWYSVSLADLKQLVPNFPAKVGKRQLAELLSMRYPDHKWDNVTLLKGRYAQQIRFEKAVASLFPVLTFLFLFCSLDYFLSVADVDCLGITNQTQCKERGRFDQS